MPEPYSETQKKITKESVFIALMRLLPLKDFSKITITEITEIAGVSRAAFYRNYTDKEDVIIFYLRDLFEELLLKIENLEDKNKENRIRLFFLFFKEHSEFVKVLINSKLTSLFYEQFCIYLADFFKNQTNKLSKSKVFNKFLPQYIASGLFRVLIEWIEGGTAESIDEITDFMLRITAN